MKKQFIGRKKELTHLNQYVNSGRGDLIVIKGRRRIGKSRLLAEYSKRFKHCFSFSGLPPRKTSNALAQRKEFAKQLMRQTDSIVTSFDDWGDLLHELSNALVNEPTLILLDEITWIGNKDREFLGKLKTAWDLYFSKNPHLVFALSGSLSAWIEKNILSSTGFLGRVSSTLHLNELTLSEARQFWPDTITDYEVLKVLAVTGGVPRYLEQVIPKLSAEENVRNLCFSPQGPLYDEFENIFSDLFDNKNELYKKIVAYLASGKATLNSIVDGLELERGGHISKYLNDLIKSGFIQKDYSWHIKTGTISKKAHYRLSDNYSRFYLKYILPRKHSISSGNFEQVALSELQAWPTIMGLQVENLILSNRRIVKKALTIHLSDIVCDNPYYQTTTIRTQACQIDYLIQTKQNCLYVCEIKYSKHRIGMEVIDEMKQKIDRLAVPKHFSIRPVLIHINGVSEQVESEQYFSYLIDVTDLM
jgi:AAA+ ATPase superfamily predicted ATPase